MNVNFSYTLIFTLMSVVSGPVLADSPKAIEYKNDVDRLSAEVEHLKQENGELKKKVDYLTQTEEGLLKEIKVQFDDLKVISAEADGLTKSREIANLSGKFLSLYPHSKSLKLVENIKFNSNKKIEMFSALIAFLDLMAQKEFAKAHEKLESVKSLCDKKIFHQLLDSLERAETDEKNHPDVFSSYRQFHKSVSTGIEIGKKYQVFAKLANDGTYFRNPDDEQDYDTFVRFSDGWIGSDVNRSRLLYDLRGKNGCFTVHITADNTIELDDFTSSLCKVSQKR